ncbi:MAG TPA: HD domain-containing phosphohydrolase, partial [Capsulimonadaceae bacterium]|nr:HD domain-containing phosphohydrolase [Capsulimonadaceae bacterium]
MGHAVRTCLIGMRIGSDFGLTGADLAGLHYGMLLKDAGGSSVSARMHGILSSEDVQSQGEVKIVNWCSLSEAIRFAVAHTLPEGTFMERANRVFAMIGAPSKLMGDMAHDRGNRGSEFAAGLGLGEQTGKAIYSLEEHWDGSGVPHGLKGEEIPVQARIGCLAQTLDVFVNAFGTGPAYEVINTRRGKWFDPALVDTANRFAQDTSFWKIVRKRPQDGIAQLNRRFREASEDDIDTVCETFARIVDAKSPFTANHSHRVRDYASQIAEEFDFTPEKLTFIRRAALLHDIGKLAVPNTILDKEGKLTPDEFDCVKLHPYHTWQILRVIPGFARMAEVAGAHHERLDGSGYFRSLWANQLDQEMRILAVADAFDAMTAERPYKKPLDADEALKLLAKEADITLDGACIEALKSAKPQAELLAA